MMKRNNKEVKHIYKGNYALPEEYEEVEYLESTGTQYIKTNIVPTENDVISFDGDFLKEGNNVPFGARESGDYATNGYKQVYFNINTSSGQDPRPFVYITNANIKEYPNYEIYDKRPTIRQRFTFTISLASHGFTQEERKYPYYLFALNDVGNTTVITSFKIRLFAIKDRINLIPAVRKSDSKPGMYDLISGEFFTNQGEGEFITGPEVKKKVKFIIKDNRVIFADESLLPSEYRRVKYLESHGTEYINTQIIPSIEDTIYLSVYSIDSKAFFGSDNFVTARGETSMDYWRVFNIKGIAIRSVDDILNKWCKYLYYNQVLQEDKHKLNSNNNECTAPLFLFARQSGEKGKCRIDKFYIVNKIYIIPVVRNSDNKPGMYDLVTNTFFSNEGTGEFTWEEL